MEKKKLNELQIKELRKVLKEELESIALKDDEYIKLDIDKDTLEQIIFDTDDDGKRTFAFDFNLIMMKRYLLEPKSEKEFNSLKRLLIYRYESVNEINSFNKEKNNTRIRG